MATALVITILAAVVAHAWAKFATISLRARIAYLELELIDALRGYEQIRADAFAEAMQLTQAAYESSLPFQDGKRAGDAEGYQRGLTEAAEIQAEMYLLRQSGELLEKTV